MKNSVLKVFKYQLAIGDIRAQMWAGNGGLRANYI